jgi:hypothetical protein
MQSSSADLACCLTTPTVAKIMWPMWQTHDGMTLTETIWSTSCMTLIETISNTSCKTCHMLTLSTTNFTRARLGSNMDLHVWSQPPELWATRTAHSSLVLVAICTVTSIKVRETEWRTVNYTSEEAKLFQIFCFGATAPSRSWPPHSQGF